MDCQARSMAVAKAPGRRHKDGDLLGTSASVGVESGVQHGFVISIDLNQSLP